MSRRRSLPKQTQRNKVNEKWKKTHTHTEKRYNFQISLIESPAMKKMSTASKMVDSEQVKRKVVSLICWAYYSQHFAVWYANTIQICIVQSGFNDFAISNDDQFWFRHKPKSDIFFHQKWFRFFNHQRIHITFGNIGQFPFWNDALFSEIRINHRHLAILRMVFFLLWNERTNAFKWFQPFGVVVVSDLFALCARNLHSSMIALFGSVILQRFDPIFFFRFRANVWNALDAKQWRYCPGTFENWAWTS